MTPPATLRGHSFGQGAHDLVTVENLLVLFLLALLGGLLLLGYAFVRIAARRPDRLPPETHALLDELASPAPPAGAAPESLPRSWERDADWWRPPTDHG
jgi:hypothetical protein